ncbi:hypothetical protein [Desulfosoma caldarium]|uniref:DUF2188 domain-containing protein n=1 Tax=Desulfosoma caldarium TaxID=610254 RepID=A0A3N1VRT2_9BACT|nr:hypothetical protein [Desulfosoma caldarium]ROR02962.1 hypothetical protein EDC27_0216 [Desulfosoma caldarium]
MAWHVIVFWKSFGTGPLGWHWRIANAEVGLEEEGSVDSVEQAMEAARGALGRHGVDPKAVRVEVWDEGVWEKC